MRLGVCLYVCVCVLVTQLCPTLCNRMDCSLPGSSVHGIIQARILELIAIPFSRGSSWPRDWTQVSCTAGIFFTVWTTRESESHSVLSDSVTPWTVACQAPLSMEFSRQEYWNRLPFPSPKGDLPTNLPNPGIEPRSPALQADSLPAEPQGKPTNTGVNSLSLLQQIFPAQKSNWGLLHCRQILYLLSYQGSPWATSNACYI